MNDGLSSSERKRVKGIGRLKHVARDTLMEKQMISLSELQNEAIRFSRSLYIDLLISPLSK